MDQQNPRTRRRALTPVTAALWAVLLLASQALAVAHLHFDGATDTTCAVCPLAKAQTAASDPAPALPSEPPEYLQPATTAPGSPRPTCHSSFLARGPPSA